jgi:hypothetical protein
MKKEVDEKACFLGLPNGLNGDLDYNSHFVRAKNPNKPGANNRQAEEVNADEVMGDIMC